MHKLTHICTHAQTESLIHAQRHAHTYQILHTHTHIYIQSRCAMTQRVAAGVKAPVAVVSCHHLEEYMSPCLLSQQHNHLPATGCPRINMFLYFICFFTHVYVQYLRIQHHKRDALLGYTLLQSHPRSVSVSCPSGRSGTLIRGALIKL